MMHMPNMSDNSSSAYNEKVVESYLKAIQLIDDRVTPFLGKATTRVLVQGASKRVSKAYPFLHFLRKDALYRSSSSSHYGTMEFYFPSGTF